MNDECMSKKNYEILCTAVIRQAIRDYEHGQRMMKKYQVNSSRYNEGKQLTGSVKSFFHSERFNLFSSSDGPALFRVINEKFEECGHCTIEQDINQRKWAVDFHDTLIDVWIDLEHLKERVMKSGKCSSRLITDLNYIQERITTLSYDDEIIETCCLEEDL